MATSGPGATNMVTGIATAMLDSSPVVCITGQVSSKLLGSDAFQEIDITGITMPITKHNVVVSRAEDIARTVREAFVIANSGRPGPVLVDITKDAQQASCDFDFEAAKPKLPPKRQRLNYDKAEFDRALQMLNSAKRPLILAGHGIIVSGAMKTFEQFVRAGHFPVAMTLLGIGCFPAGDPDECKCCTAPGETGLIGGTVLNECCDGQSPQPGGPGAYFCPGTCSLTPFPTCGGNCQPGRVCGPVSAAGTFYCACVPPGPCSGTPPMCTAGECPVGQYCSGDACTCFDVP